MTCGNQVKSSRHEAIGTMLPYGSASGHKAPSREEKRREEKRREEKRREEKRREHLSASI